MEEHLKSITNKQGKSTLKLLTKGQLITHLKDTISNAGKSIYIVGPWLDAYFTRTLVNSLSNKEVDVKFVVRMDDGVIDTKTLSALNLARQNLKNFQAKSLENLHSKVILIDGEIFFLGSANWYWYSLNIGVEVTVKGDITLLPELLQILDHYWIDSSPINIEDIKKSRDFNPLKTPCIQHTLEIIHHQL